MRAEFGEGDCCVMVGQLVYFVQVRVDFLSVVLVILRPY